MQKNSEDSITLRTAEKKLLVGFLAILVVGLTSAIDTTLAAGRGPQLRIALNNYFTCEEKGYNSEDVCTQPDVLINENALAEALFDVAFGLFQLAAFLYFVDFQLLKKKMKSIYSKLHEYYSQSTNA